MHNTPYKATEVSHFACSTSRILYPLFSHARATYIFCTFTVLLSCSSSTHVTELDYTFFAAIFLLAKTVYA